MDGPFTISGKQRRIDYSIVQPAPGNTILTYGMSGGKKGIRNYMAYMREIVKKYPDRLIGCFTYNPRFGVENGVSEFERHVKENGFRMLKIHSLLHAYRPDKVTGWIFPVVEKAVRLKVPILIHTGDPPYSIPSQFYPVIEHFPDAQIILAHLGTQIGASYNLEAGWMAKKNDNVFVELGLVPQVRIADLVEFLGPEKVIFATDTPPNDPGIFLRMLDVLNWERPQGIKIKEEDLEKILGNNIAKMIGLKLRK